MTLQRAAIAVIQEALSDHTNRESNLAVQKVSSFCQILTKSNVHEMHINEYLLS